MNDYELGNVVRMTAAFTDANSSPADPTTVTCTLRRTAGDVWTFTYPANITKDGTGVYHCDWTSIRYGVFDYRWSGTGAVIASDEGTFRILNSTFT